MPSFTVPMFSNNIADCHMMYCDKPFKRSAMVVATATAPTPTWPFSHSQMPSAVVLNTSKAFTVNVLKSSKVAKRICACTVCINSCIDSRA